MNYIQFLAAQLEQSKTQLLDTLTRVCIFCFSLLCICHHCVLLLCILRCGWVVWWAVADGQTIINAFNGGGKAQYKWTSYIHKNYKFWKQIFSLADIIFLRMALQIIELFCCAIPLVVDTLNIKHQEIILPRKDWELQKGSKCKTSGNYSAKKRLRALEGQLMYVIQCVLGHEKEPKLHLHSPFTFPNVYKISISVRPLLSLMYVRYSFLLDLGDLPGTSLEQPSAPKLNTQPPPCHS